MIHPLELLPTICPAISDKSLIQLHDNEKLRPRTAIDDPPKYSIKPATILINYKTIQFLSFQSLQQFPRGNKEPEPSSTPNEGGRRGKESADADYLWKLVRPKVTEHL